MQQVALLVTLPLQKVINLQVVQGDGDYSCTSGEKKTGVDAGVSPSFSFTDDYLYVCVKGGDQHTAIWKKTLLFQT